MAGTMGKAPTKIHTAASPYPKVNYSAMGGDLEGDVKGSYQSPGTEWGPDITPNPWEIGLSGQIQGGAYNNKYAGFNSALAQKLMGLGNADYSGDLYNLAEKGITKSQATQQAKLNAMGVGELSLREDVQDYWSGQRRDAATAAKIEAENMRRAGLQTAVQGIQSMAGTDLDYAVKQSAALLGGGGMWLDYQKTVAPLISKMASSEEASKKRYGGAGAGQYVPNMIADTTASGGGGGGSTRTSTAKKRTWYTKPAIWK